MQFNFCISTDFLCVTFCRVVVDPVVKNLCAVDSSESYLSKVHMENKGSGNSNQSPTMERRSKQILKRDVKGYDNREMQRPNTAV